MKYYSRLMPALICATLTGCASTVRITGTVLRNAPPSYPFHNPPQTDDGIAHYELPVLGEDGKEITYFFYLDGNYTGGVPPPYFHRGNKVDFIVKKKNVTDIEELEK